MACDKCILLWRLLFHIVFLNQKNFFGLGTLEDSLTLKSQWNCFHCQHWKAWQYFHSGNVKYLDAWNEKLQFVKGTFRNAKCDDWCFIAWLGNWRWGFRRQLFPASTCILVAVNGGLLQWWLLQGCPACRTNRSLFFFSSWRDQKNVVVASLEVLLL